jgi:hypothetical protein
MAPQSVARGPPRSGDRAAAGMPDRAKMQLGCLQPAAGSHLPLEDTAPPYAVSPDFTATQVGRGLRAVCLVRLLAKERPRAQPEGSCEAGIGQRRGCQDRARILLGRLHPATGSHLPSEETAPPCAGVPFASSPFVHPIPQSHRRASENLFRAS